MKKYLILIMLGVLFAGTPAIVQSSIVTKTFIGTVLSGPLLGEIGTGTFSYDDDLISAGDEEINLINGLEVSFSFYGQNFDGTNDFDFDKYPILEFRDFKPFALDYVMINGESGVNFNYSNLEELSMYGLLPSSGNYDFETELAATVPIPGAVWLLGSGLIGLAGIRRRFIN